MFEKSYAFRKVQIDRARKEDFVRRHIYTFYGKFGKKYIVWLEEYKSDTYAVKFHLRSHRKREDKYNITTKHFEATRVLATCLQIMVAMLRENGNASFAFVGANLNEEKDSPANNKRFRVYRRIMARFFSPIQFEHVVNAKINAYLLINQKTPKGKDLKKQIIDMFNELYESELF